MVGMDFGAALEQLNNGGRVFRTGWNGKGMWVAMHHPLPGEKMTKPFLYLRTADGHNVPWAASQTDALAKDWSNEFPKGTPV